MKTHKFIFLIAAVGIASQNAFAIEPIPIAKNGHCPNEYQTQGDFCVPIKAIFVFRFRKEPDLFCIVIQKFRDARLVIL